MVTLLLQLLFPKVKSVKCRSSVKCLLRHKYVSHSEREKLAGLITNSLSLLVTV